MCKLMSRFQKNPIKAVDSCSSLSATEGVNVGSVTNEFNF